MSADAENRNETPPRTRGASHRGSRAAVHRSFQELFRQIEDFWIASGRPAVPESEVPDMVKRIILALESAVDEDVRERARRNLQAAFTGTPAAVSQNEWISPNEAARYLRMSRTTLHKMMQSGELKFRQRKVGQHLRILRCDVEAYWQKLMADRDLIKVEMVRQAEALGLYEVPDQ